MGDMINSDQKPQNTADGQGDITPESVAEELKSAGVDIIPTTEDI